MYICINMNTSISNHISRHRRVYRLSTLAHERVSHDARGCLIRSVSCDRMNAQ